MIRSRPSSHLAAIAMSAAHTSTSRTAFTDADLLHAKFTGATYIDDGNDANTGGPGGIEPVKTDDGTSAAAGKQLQQQADTNVDSAALGDPPRGISRAQAGFSLVELMGALGAWLAGMMGVQTVAPYAKTAIAWAASFFS